MPITRTRPAAVGCALLISVSTACGSSGQTDPESRVHRAVEKLGEWDRVTVTTRVTAPAEDIQTLLRHHHERGGGVPAPSPRDARLLSRLELTSVLGADGPLKDIGEKDRLDSAAAMNLGARDLLAYKSIGTDFYVRVRWKALAEELRGRNETVTQAAALAGSADGLPPSLAAAKDMLRGRWVQIDPAEFDRFARAVGGKHGERAERLANSVDFLQNARAQHHIVDALRGAANGHASFEDGGRSEGVDRIRVTIPAREAARDLAGALKPLEERFDGIGFSWLRRAPEREVTVELALRDGTLSGLTVDLAQFAAPGSGVGRLPLDFSFAVGDAVPVEVPERARWLDPQDVMAAALYETLGTPED